MKVLLLIPPKFNVFKRNIAPSTYTIHLGVAYLAAKLRSVRHETYVIDSPVENLTFQGFRKRIAKIRPDFVGITANTEQILEAGEAARIVKQMDPHIPIVIGGSHSTALTKETLEELPLVDFAVFGEGEITLCELLERIRGKASFSDVAGLAYRNGEEIILNSPRPHIENIDSLPLPAFDLFPMNRYHPSYRARKTHRELPISTSRGCPYECVFCTKIFGSQVRYRSPDAVVEEIAYYVERFGINQLFITDENFTLNQERTYRICEEIVRHGLHRKLDSGCETRTDLVDRKILRALKRANVKFILFGIESGDPRTLAFAKKNIPLEQTKEAICIAKEEGFEVLITCIIGFPHEGREEVQKTLRFAEELDPHFLVLNILTPFPGTAVWKMIKSGEGGSRLISRDWSRFGTHLGLAHESGMLPRWELEKFQRQAYMKFYLRPNRIKYFIRSVKIKFFPLYLFHQGTSGFSWSNRFRILRRN